MHPKAKSVQVQTQVLQSKYDMGEKNSTARINDLFTRPRGRQKNAAAVCCTFNDCERAGEESQLEKRVCRNPIESKNTNV